ncbi:Origin recognition complex subunit 2 [Sporothrix bragantina]|uniref:Origin recognition complex subunit 2 n=1 Tax=Sporothrix bragantina TaxID=671064 RepID=A0ABP0CLK1_9PEZI
MTRALSPRNSSSNGATAVSPTNATSKTLQNRHSPPENRPAKLQQLGTPTKSLASVPAPALASASTRRSQTKDRAGAASAAAVPAGANGTGDFENHLLMTSASKAKRLGSRGRKSGRKSKAAVVYTTSGVEEDVEDLDAGMAPQEMLLDFDYAEIPAEPSDLGRRMANLPGDLPAVREGQAEELVTVAAGEPSAPSAEPPAAAEETPAVDANATEEDEPAPVSVETPKKRGRGRPPKARFADRFDEPGTPVGGTPNSKRRKTDPFATPTKATPSKAARGLAAPTPNTRRTLADRSARKKSTRALIDRMVAGDGDDDDEDEAALNAAILDAEDDDDEEEEEEAEEVQAEKEEIALGQDLPPPAAEEVAPTPRKRGRPPKAKGAAGAATPVKARVAAAAPAVGPDGVTPIKRGRGRPRKTDLTAPSNVNPTNSASARMPTPPRDLPAHEHYFYQNRAGAGIKTSNNTLAAMPLLTYDEYFRLRETTARHEKEVGYLEALHAQSFTQWAFELTQGFSVCLYGYGSKQRVLRAFATALHKGIRDHAAHKIVMANTSTAGVAVPAGAAGSSAAVHASASAAASTLRDILLVMAAAATTMSAKSSKEANAPPPKLPSGAAAGERIVLGMLDRLGSHQTVTLILNGIDSPSLRRPAAQATLARLAAHPRVHLLCAADTPGFALLWDGAARSQQNFVFHDATTFRPLAGLDTVDEVHALLGRRVRRVGGKDGAAFVLRSLPENARTLFQLLIGEVLAADDGGGGGGRGGYGGDDDDGYDDDMDGEDRDGGAAESVALEYRMLYNKAVEEFICSSEMAFRTLLKEFHDHQMVTSRKDAFGTEMLSLPFRRDELEALLEDLAS